MTLSRKLLQAACYALLGTLVSETMLSFRS